MKFFLLICLLPLFAGEAMAWNCETPCPEGEQARHECHDWQKIHCTEDRPFDDWGKAGARALPAAAQTMENQNQTGKYLPERLIHALRPIFGPLTDQLKITWDARLVDQWAALDHHIPLRDVDLVAQAYGYNIYIAQPESALQSQPDKTLALLIHAAAHAQQMDKANGVATFGDEYFRAHKQAGLQFADNHFEQQAAAKTQKYGETAFNRYKDATCPSIPNIEIHARGQNKAYSRGKTWQNCAGYKLVFQLDANLVLYGPGDGQLWSTGTGGTEADRMVIQADGNVVLYVGERPIWATDTQGEENFFAIQEDGNMIVYGRERRALWSSGTEGGRKQTLNAAAEWQEKHQPTKLAAP